MFTGNHGHRAAVKAAWAASGTAATLTVCLTAKAVCDALGDGPRGLTAGFAVLTAVFVSCWFIHSIPRRHPAPPRRPAPGRDPELTGPQPVLTGIP